ncbi:MAG: hypothetical protein A2749_01925 [Parcubacteria group bacterium RIFCSPHIGHO2_01_FULL_45_26]|nr:MAG: hypothetical protein A2749_01925 [Parcubacteria group bacterium RIFCSPHIGHO2_01_FULL_45_26]
MFWLVVLGIGGAALANVITSHILKRPRLRALGANYTGDTEEEPQCLIAFAHWIIGIGGVFIGLANTILAIEKNKEVWPFPLAYLAGMALYGLGWALWLGVPDIKRSVRAWFLARKRRKESAPERILANCTNLFQQSTMALAQERIEAVSIGRDALHALRELQIVMSRLISQGELNPKMVAEEVDSLYLPTLGTTAREGLAKVRGRERDGGADIAAAQVLCEELVAFFVAFPHSARVGDLGELQTQVDGFWTRLEHFGFRIDRGDDDLKEMDVFQSPALQPNPPPLDADEDIAAGMKYDPAGLRDKKEGVKT